MSLYFLSAGFQFVLAEVRVWFEYLSGNALQTCIKLSIVRNLAPFRAEFSLNLGLYKV